MKIDEEAPEAKNQRLTVADLLEKSAQSIRLAKKMLNVAEHECDSCHRKSNENWTEAQAAAQLASIISKLVRWEKRFRTARTDQPLSPE